jgi:hypothetical protein
MERIYCGGRFCFDFLNEDFESRAAEDYRTHLLGDVSLLIGNDRSVRLSDNLEYVGPFYCQTDGAVDGDIVAGEMRQIEECTYAFFLLDDCGCPGSITELLYAAYRKKRIVIYYVIDERETESRLFSPCWYPILHCQQVNGALTEVVPCIDLAEAGRRIAERVNNMK